MRARKRKTEVNENRSQNMERRVQEVIVGRNREGK